MVTELAQTGRPAMRSFFAARKSFVDGRSTPRAFLEVCIASIEAQEPDVHAFVATNFEGARTAADAATGRWQAGETLSSIDGMPLCIKDIMETADMPTEQGSALFAGWRGGRDCAAVAALREAGAIILGKSVTTEFATQPPGGTRNPWDLARTPGGSSSGTAAAIAAGMAPAGLGSQGLGSTIRPASFCGVFAFKPSVGGINRGGSFDAVSQSCTSTFAATLEETWEVARAISARAGGDPGFPGLGGPMEAPAPRTPGRVAILETAGWDRAVDDARRALDEARERLAGAGIEIVDRRSHDGVVRVEEVLADAIELSSGLIDWEFRWPLNTYVRDMDRAGLSEAAIERIEAAEAMTLEDYQALLKRRRKAREIHAALKKECDVCVTLSAPGPAPIGLDWTGDPVFAVPSSVLGVPSVSLPVLQAEGLPLGLQVMGFADTDASLFAAAASIHSLFAGG